MLLTDTMQQLLAHKSSSYKYQLFELVANPGESVCPNFLFVHVIEGCEGQNVKCILEDLLSLLQMKLSLGYSWRDGYKYLILWVYEPRYWHLNSTKYTLLMLIPLSVSLKLSKFLVNVTFGQYIFLSRASVSGSH